MAAVNYTLRVDEIDKQKAEQVFKELGMTFSTGINIYLKIVGRQKQVPFFLTLNDNNLETINNDNGLNKKRHSKIVDQNESRIKWLNRLKEAQKLSEDEIIYDIPPRQKMREPHGLSD